MANIGAQRILLGLSISEVSVNTSGVDTTVLSGTATDQFFIWGFCVSNTERGNMRVNLYENASSGTPLCYMNPHGGRVVMLQNPIKLEQGKGIVAYTKTEPSNSSYRVGVFYTRG